MSHRAYLQANTTIIWMKKDIVQGHQVVMLIIKIVEIKIPMAMLEDRCHIK
jgi:hypothetical protein